jgi:hypothetical protein
MKNVSRSEFSHDGEEPCVIQNIALPPEPTVRQIPWWPEVDVKNLSTTR